MRTPLALRSHRSLTVRSSTLPLLLLCSACEGVVLLPGTHVSPQGEVLGPHGEVITPTGGGTGGGGETPPPVDRFTCTPDAISEDVPLRRLSRVQFQNNVQAVVRAWLPTSGSTVLAQVASQLAALPGDAAVAPPSFGATGFRRADQVVAQAHADAHYQLAVDLGRAMTSSKALLEELFGTCATDANTANDGACISTFLQTKGVAALRAPLSTDDLAFYASATRGAPLSAEVAADLAALVLASPPMLFLVEGRGQQPQDAALSADELASRLAFTLWNAPPDDALWSAARDGSLLTEGGYDAQVDRLLKDSKAQAVRDEFFSEWLDLERAPDLPAKLNVAAFASLLKGPAPTAATRAAVIDDVRLATQALVARDALVAELLTDRHAFVNDAFVGQLYGLPVGSQGVVASGSARSGLLTRPAFVISGGTDTHPIRKGVRIRTNLLCELIGAPPSGASMQVAPKPTASQLLTTRQRVELLTQTQGSSCAACHARLINPLGFVTENFDGLGQERSEEVIFDDQGQRLGTAPVDVAANPNLSGSGTTPVSGADGLNAAILASGKFEACFVAQYFRFTSGKAIEDSGDGCRLRVLHQAVRAGAGMGSAMKAFVTSADFKRRLRRD